MNLNDILELAAAYINWVSNLPIDPFWFGAVGIPPLAALAVWLAYGEDISAIWDHLGPDTATVTETAHGAAQTVAAIPSVITRRVPWSDVPGVQARQYAKQMTAGRWVLPMREIHEDRRAEKHRPPCLEMDNSVFVLGETGIGKTNTFKVLFEQQTFDNNTPVVVFDYKDDYFEFFTEQGYDVLRVTPVRENTNVTWNVFDEIVEEDDIKEIAQGITEGLDIEVDVDFWDDAGSLLLEAIMTFLFRQAMAETGQPPTNKDLVHYLQSNEPEGIYQDLKKHTDLNMPAGSIDPEAKRLGLSVIATMAVDVQRTFFGAFAEAGSFTIREYVTDPDGKILLFDLPRKRQASTKPVYQFLVDWAATHALMTDNQSIFLLDEFATVPRLAMIEDLVNRGRSYNTQVMLGVQSLTQVADTYGSSKANSILSGCTQQILMGTNDPESAEYVQEKIGPDIDEQTVPAHNNSGEVIGTQLRQVERYPVSRSVVDQFGKGEAVVKKPDGEWVHGEIEKFEDIEDVIESARMHVERQSDDDDSGV